MLHKRLASLLMAVLMLCVAVVPVGVSAEDVASAPVEVTEAPLVEVTEAPTEIPTEAPTEVPTETPTEVPTEAPTEVPTEAPTEVPTEAPTAAPTEAPDVFVPGYARLSGGTKLYDTPALQGEASKLDGSAVVYAAKRIDDKTAVKVAVFDGASVVEKWVKAERVAMMSAAEVQQHEASCGDGCASYAGCVLPAATVVAPQPAATEAPVMTEAPVEAPAAGIADMIATVATNPPVVAPSLPSGEQVATIESRSPLKVVALHAASATANVGDTLTFTTQFEGSGDIAWIEYHIYNTVGQHLTGYRGEGAGISGVYHYDTAVTGAGRYCARVYLMAKDGTFTHVDSIWVTVENDDPLHVTALTPDKTSAAPGESVTFTAQTEGDGQLAWVEYHLYNQNYVEIHGWRGDGRNAVKAYRYTLPREATNVTAYFARVYMMAADGTFSQADSAWVKTSDEPLTVTALEAASLTANVGDKLTFTTQFAGKGDIAWIEYHIYNIYGQHLTGYHGEGAGISGVYHYDTSVTGPGKYCARVYLMATDGTFTHVDSEWISVTGKGEENGFTYTISDGEATVTGYVGKVLDQGLNIPATLGGCPVRKIGDSAFRKRSDLSGSLTIPNGVTSIGDKAFWGCDGLIGSLILPDGLTSIGEYAFYKCSGFTSRLTFPDKLVSIGDWGFHGCSGFTGSLSFPDRLTSIGEHGFSECTGFSGTLTFPDGLTSIGSLAFYKCTGFTGSLTLPDNLTSINAGTFELCSGFTGSLTLPDKLTFIHDSAFRGCSGFTGNLTLPDGLTSIGYQAFYYCHNFTGNLTFPDGLTFIGKEAFFDCDGFTGSLSFPDGLTSISSGAFYDCDGFNGSLSFPDGLTEIGIEAFYNCHCFTGSLIFPDGLTSIGYAAFRTCRGLKDSLTFPASLTEIGSRAFYNCPGLTTVHAPVGSYAAQWAVNNGYTLVAQ